MYFSWELGSSSECHWPLQFMSPSQSNDQGQSSCCQSCASPCTCTGKHSGNTRGVHIHTQRKYLGSHLTRRETITPVWGQCHVMTICQYLSPEKRSLDKTDKDAALHRQSGTDNDDNPDFELGMSGEPHLIAQSEWNDLVRERRFVKTKAELLGSRLQGWCLLSPGAIDTETHLIPCDSDSFVDVFFSSWSFIAMVNKWKRGVEGLSATTAFFSTLPKRKNRK